MVMLWLAFTLVSWAATPATYEDNCLADGIKKEHRRYMKNNGVDTPFVLQEINVNAGLLPGGFFSDILRILMQELVGVHVTRPESGRVASSNQAIKALAGCQDVTTSGCIIPEDYDGSSAHALVGYWQSYAAQSWNELDDSIRPYVKYLGCAGWDGMFVKDANVKNAAKDKLDITWVANYGVTALPSHNYFSTSIAQLEVTPLSCAKSPYYQPDSLSLQTYISVSNDTAGGAEACVQGCKGTECLAGWWLAPSCRANPDTCIPVITAGDGWSVDKFMQYSHFYNAPLAIGTVSWSDYVSLGLNSEVMFYWWFPDMMFAHSSPASVNAPGANLNEQAKGVWRTGNSKDAVMKGKWRGLAAMDRFVNELYDNLEANDADVFDAIDGLKAQSPGRISWDFYDGMVLDRYRASCEWVKANSHRWTSWVPDKTACLEGEGVTTVGDNSFCEPCPEDEVSVVGEGGLRRCGQCPAGEINVDGVCVKCHFGTYNEIVGATECTPCPASTYGALTGGTSKEEACVSCPLGTFAVQDGSSFCPPCPAGTHATKAGAVECDACPAGTFSVDHEDADGSLDGMQTCEPCTAGNFCPEECAEPIPCENGQFALAGAEVCSRCPARTFQAKIGQEDCQKCPPNFTSPPGSTQLYDCACAQDSYYDEADDKCVACIQGMICMQGRQVPFVEAGYYAEPVKGAWKGQHILGSDGTWSHSSDSADQSNKPAAGEQYFSKLLVWSCPFGEAACPGTTLETDDGFIAQNARRAGECAAGKDFMHVNGCSRCFDGYYYSNDDGACLSCTGGDGALFPILFLIGLGIMLGLYKLTKSSASVKLTNMLMFSCSASLLINFFQLLGVIGFYHAEFPDFLSGFFDFFQLFVFDVDVLRASCMTGSDFSSRFLTRMVSPVLFLIAFLACYPLSVVLNTSTGGKVGKMDWLNLVNTSGLVMNASYIALCKMSMQYYECKSQPQADATVAAYPDVNCQSDDHVGLMGVAVVATIVYGAGIYVLCMYLCYVAPTLLVKSRDFRRKTRFLVGRWNPGRWYWGPVLQTRNLLISLVAVGYPSDGTMQFIVTGAIVVLYTAMQATMEPWRDLFLNVTDTILGVAIILTCMFGVLLVEDIGDMQLRTSNAQAYLAAIFFVAFAVLSYAIGKACYFMVNPKKASRKDLMYTRQATKVLLLQTMKMFQLLKEGTTESEFGEALGNYMTFAEQRQIFKIGKVLLHELCGVQYKADVDFKRLMINAVDESGTVEINEVDIDMLLNAQGDEKATLIKNRVSALSRVGGQQH